MADGVIEQTEFGFEDDVTPGGPWVIRPFNFQSKLKIENRCQFFIFLSFLSREINKRVSINISPFSRS